MVLESDDAETVLYLREGAGATSGDHIGFNEGEPPDSRRAMITQDLDAGTYTIEATTYAAGETGAFTLTINAESAILPPQPPPPPPLPPSPDRATLVEFYNATGGPNWLNNSGWLSNAHVSRWRGVWTDSSGRVIALGLHGNNLSGPIPPALGDLTRMEQLFIWGNGLTGEIPTELGNLTRMERMNLGANELTGQIPEELGNMTKLEFLFVGFNPLDDDACVPASLRDTITNPNTMGAPFCKE